MGAYFQAPHAAPGQRQMEIHFCTSETNVSLMCWTHIHLHFSFLDLTGIWVIPKVCLHALVSFLHL